MLFNSFAFIVLVLVTFLFYYIPRFSRWQVTILIVASLLFYSYSHPILLALLLLSAGINIITSYYVVYGIPKRRKLISIIGVVSNLLILFFFKYSPLFAKTFLATGSSIGHFLIMVPLPVGISFYTFQGISLVVDVYKEKYFNNEEVISPSLLKHSKHILLFISFFPSLVAGPIVKAHDYLPQIKTKFISNVEWSACFKMIILGYFFKMVVADNLKDFTAQITFPFFQSETTFTLITLLFGYSFQIFADFAGYSLIAIGVAKLYGYNLRDNFLYPYISTSFKEFWKRWHISLSSFLMEYLYIPLGGNRKGKFRTYLNLFITMALGGLWHGAAWSYVIWGTFHGVLLATERFINNALGYTSETKNGFILTLKWLMVFSLVTFGWLLFKLPDFTHVIGYVKAMINNFSFSINMNLCSKVIIFSFPIIGYHVFFLCQSKKWYRCIKKYEYIFYAIMLFFIITNSGTSSDFIYFQF